ncbi:MAG: hypothetical protein SOU51_05315 [Collinsella sp.]|nr:hypothetical protein [Collinsella sp.]
MRRASSRSTARAPNSASNLFTVKYFDADDNAVNDDERYGDYAAKIVPKDEFEDALITTTDGGTIAFGEGTLRIRHVSNFAAASQNKLTTKAVKYDDGQGKAEAMAAVEKTGHASVILSSSTTISLNGKEQYQYPQELTDDIALLFDELLPKKAGGDNDTYTKMLVDHAKHEGFSMKGKSYEFRHLDLVDKENSDAWVSSSEGSDVFWPYPSGTSKGTDFELLHFQGLHRE